MSSVRLVERFNFSGGRVDRSGSYPVVRGVLLCGENSKNGRIYRREAFGGGRHKKYEGKPVFIGHGDFKKARSYSEQLGWIENVRLNSSGMPIGDVGIKPGHPMAEAVLWDCENRPQAAGMSHVARCQTRAGKGKVEEVVSLEEVESVDLVLDPATTKNFYEQRGGAVRESAGGNRETVPPVPRTGAAFAASLEGDYYAHKGLVETDGVKFAESIRGERPAHSGLVPTDGVKFAASIRN